MPPAVSRVLSHHDESTAFVPAPPARLFAHVDDHARLSSHMNESSWMMGGGRMDLELDAGRGQRVGSRIRVAGRVFGLYLSLEEVVIERNPPLRKVWETTVPPRLLVIGHYRMGFDITPTGDGAQFRVFIDYALPEAAPTRWLGYVFGRYYARWCTERMVRDAWNHFAGLDRTRREER
jgi:hypothetical protein